MIVHPVHAAELAELQQTRPELFAELDALGVVVHRVSKRDVRGTVASSSLCQRIEPGTGLPKAFERLLNGARQKTAKLRSK